MFPKRDGAMANKKAQITAIIIIGVLLLLVVGMGLYITSKPKDISVQLAEEVVFQKEVEAIESFVTSCIQEVAKPLILQLAANGGTFEPREFRIYDNQLFPYLCKQESGFGCVAVKLSRLTMEKELDEAIRDEFQECVDFSAQEDRGFEFDQGLVNVTTTIGARNIFIKIKTPIEIRWRDAEATIENFNTNLAFDLGVLYEAMRDIMKHEVENNFFDEASWMERYGGEVEIEKHKPYPDIVYTLKKYREEVGENFVFRFAVQGKDTTQSLIHPDLLYRLKGFCVEEGGTCIANSDPGDCREIGGFWHNKKPFECTLDPTFNDPNCEGDSCLDCGYWRHGESWCEYDDIVGPGFDFVGTRHYKQTCINGRIFNTECRDFREEICVQDDSGDLTQAICRDNRWEECSKLTEEVACLNTTVRDCHWRDWLNKSAPWACLETDYSEQRCSPFTPPGFKHWTNQGQKACDLANEQQNCDEESCPQKWVDSTYINCYAQGDCAFYWNAERNMSDPERYFNDDRMSPWQGRPRNYTYLIPFQKGTYRLNLTTETTRAEFGYDVFDYPSGSRETLLKMREKWQQGCSKPRVTSKNIHSIIIATAACGVWAPNETINYCERCDNDPRKPCSEYKCRSMGTNCAFEEVNGTGQCFTLMPDYEPPELNISLVRLLNLTAPIERQMVEQDEENISAYGLQEYSLEDYKDYGIDGKRVTEQVEPFMNMMIKVSANEPVECRVGHTSLSTFESMPPMRVGFNNHTLLFTKTIPPTEAMKAIRRELGVSSPMAVFMFDTYKKEFEDRKRDQLVRASRTDETNRSEVESKLEGADKLLEEMLAPALAQIRGLFQKMFIGFMRNEVTPIIICRDRFDNEARLLFNYKIQDDIYPPVIVETIPEQGAVISSPALVTLLLNEPSECRRSVTEQPFDEMDKHFRCMKAVEESSELYECEDQILLGEGKNRFFVRCRDKPLMEKSFFLNLIKGKNFTLKSEEVYGLYLEKEPGTVNTSYLGNRFVLDIRRDCVVHPRDTVLAVAAFNETLTLCTREGDLFLCPNKINFSSPFLDDCDFANVNRTPARRFVQGIYARSDALTFNTTIIEVDKNENLLTLKLKSDFNCRYTDDANADYVGIPAEQDLDCGIGTDNRYTCRGTLLVVDEKNYRIVCQEDFIEPRNTNLKSFELIYYKA